MNYGEKISRLRKSQGMTQEELGKVLNVTYQAVSKWERGESLPDFATMSQIAKYFNVPLSYFEDGEETLPATQTEPTAEQINYIGMCTVCGKMLKEDEAFATSPKIICNDCADRQKQETLRANKERENLLKSQKEREARLQLGCGINAKLIVSLLLAIAGYIILTVVCFKCDRSDREMYAAILLIVPLAVFACTLAVFDLIDDFRDKDDGSDGFKLSLSLITGGVFTAINIALYLVLYFTSENSAYYLVLLALGAILSFTFISQILWGSVLMDIFTCGGFTFKLPGFIFSLTLDSILWMIITKIVLGIISAIVFVITTVFFALVAIFGSVITFIPCILAKTVKDKKAKSML